MDLYSSLPLQVYSVGDFVQTAEHIWETDGYAAFNRFVLTGEVHNVHQAVIDPVRNVLEDDMEVWGNRDYDSLIGLCDDIVVDSSISVYPVPKPAEVLSTSVHLTYRIQRGDTFNDVPLHRIPNFEFGYWGQRHMIHIFFPRLVSENRRSQQLSKEEKTHFFELGLRPTIADIAPQTLSDWPATYNAEMFRAQKNSGHVAYQTKQIPSWLLASLTRVLRNKLQENNVEWAEGYFYSHTIRGTKDATRHSMNHASADLALDEFLTDAKIPRLATERGSWYIDVGVEYSTADSCLQWTTSSHFHIVKEVLRIEDPRALRITSLGSTKYSRDMVSHLPAVSGCRIEPGVQAQGEFQAAYFQMYTTDKAATYNPERGYHGKAITMNAAMGTTQPAPFLEGLYELYKDAMTETTSNARVEVRVPLSKATEVLLNIDSTVVRNSLLEFTKDEWWGLRTIRTRALSLTLGSQGTGSPALRVNPDALLLTVACVWLVNGLHSRPEDGPAARNLMKAVLPITDSADHADPDTLAYPAAGNNQEEEEESDDESSAPSVPFNPYGIVFLRRIVVHVNVPRMRAGGPFISLPAFHYFFGASQREIEFKYYKVGIVPQEVIAERRVVTNKARHTTTYVAPSEDPEPNLFSLATQGHKLPPRAVDDGSDVEMEEDDGNTGDIDHEISTMWRQFLIDMALKTPNRKGATLRSYFTVSKKDRSLVGEELYKNPKLSDMWSACQYKVANKADWTRAFDHLFPPIDHLTPKNVQNYTQCTYYMKWAEIRGTADKSTVIAIRRQLEKKFSKLVWVPHAGQDKMWPTSRTAPGFTRLPPDTTGPAPRILIRTEPQWESAELSSA